jgi:hypothetical protein
MPLIDAALDEWVDGKRRSTISLLRSPRSLRRIGGASRAGAKALEAMVRDKDCARFLTISGAMTVGQDGPGDLRHDRAWHDSRDLVDGCA